MVNKIFLIHALDADDDGVYATPIQGTRVPYGNGQVIFTGNASTSAREVLNIVITLLRIKNVWIDCYDYHIHMLSSETLKSGYSWGLAAYCLLVWLTGDLPYVENITAAGQIDLHGSVTPVAMLYEKADHWVSEHGGSLYLPRIAENSNFTSEFSIIREVLFLDELNTILRLDSGR